MLGLFNRKKKITQALTNQTIGAQSLLYRLFREALECEDSSIRLIEITYFAASVMTATYLMEGKSENKEEILEEFNLSILKKSIPNSREEISIGKAVKEYQERYREYTSLFPLVFNPQDSESGNPETTLLMHVFECVIGSAKGHMIMILAASPIIQQFIFDHVNFSRSL